jgi:hypothetical protein
MATVSYNQASTFDSSNYIDPREVGKKGKGENQIAEGIEELKAIALKFKAALEGHINQTSGASSNALSALQNNPLWQSLDQPQMEKKVSKKDVNNFFILMFSALNKSSEASNSDLASKMAHMLSDLNMTQANITGSEGALAKMQADIKKAKEEEDSPLHKFLEIFTVILVVVISVVAVVASLGTAAPEVAAGDAALGAAEGAGDALLTEGGSEAMEMTDFAASSEGGSAVGEAGIEGAGEESIEGTTQGQVESQECANSEKVATQARQFALKNVANSLKTVSGAIKGFLGVAGAAGGGFGAYTGISDRYESISTNEQIEALTVLQSKTSLGSSATQNLQNEIQQDQSSISSENSNEQAALQAKQNIISAQIKINTLGNV